MAALATQPDEVLHEIFTFLYPKDLASLSATCKRFKYYVTENPLLWKMVALATWDDPGFEVDWENEVKRRTNAIGTLSVGTSTEMKLKNTPSVIETCLRLAKEASFDPVSKQSKNANQINRSLLRFPENRDTFLMNSALFHANRGGNRALALSTRAAWHRLSNQSAKLHVLFGTSLDDFELSASFRTRRLKRKTPNESVIRVHGHARADVYDLRRCNSLNEWGPWSSDRKFSVDWERVECIMIVLAYSIHELSQFMDSNFLGELWENEYMGAQENTYIDRYPIGADEEYVPQPIVFPESLLSSVTGIAPEDMALPEGFIDPYGVTGTWQRIVCYLDYNDFYHVNFHTTTPPLHERRPQILHQEAVRLIIMRLSLAGVTKPGPEDGDGPVVWFVGTSRSMHEGWDNNGGSKIFGSVRTTKEGEVRWQSISIIGGTERWKSEGVQIGGKKSGRGVLGMWFEKDLDPRGPCGPTAFWKVTDRLEKDDSSLWHLGPQGIHLSSQENPTFPLHFAGESDVDESENWSDGDQMDDLDEEDDEDDVTLM